MLHWSLFTALEKMIDIWNIKFPLMISHHHEATELVGINDSKKAVIAVSGGSARWYKEKHQIFTGYSFFMNENSFRLDNQIHNNDRIKIFRFAEQIYNYRELYVSPGQSTYCRNFILRASIKSGELIDFVVYLFR